MPTAISRTQAKHRSLAAQGIAAVILLSGVALGIAGLPDQSVAMSEPEIIETTITPTTSQGPNGQMSPKTLQIHAGSLAQRLSMVDNAPELPEIEQPKDITPTEPTAGPNVGNIVKRLRYIGYVAETGSHAAFIRIDGTQRIVRENGSVASGDENLSDLTVKTIRPNYIIATDGKLEARIQLGKRTGKAITMANGNEITPATTAKDTPAYNERILGDPGSVPQRELDRRRRTLERSLRGEQNRSEAARLKEPENMITVGANPKKTRKARDNN